MLFYGDYFKVVGVDFDFVAFYNFIGQEGLSHFVFYFILFKTKFFIFSAAEKASFASAHENSGKFPT